MRPSELSSNAVSFGDRWHRLVFADFLVSRYDVHGRMHSSGDLNPRLVESQAFSSFGQWLSCRLFCDDILVDQSLLETALSPCYGHSPVFVCCLLSLSVSPSSLYTEGLTEKSLGRALSSYHFGC